MTAGFRVVELAENTERVTAVLVGAGLIGYCMSEADSWKILREGSQRSVRNAIVQRDNLNELRISDKIKPRIPFRRLQREWR